MKDMFSKNTAGLELGLELLLNQGDGALSLLPQILPDQGLGEGEALKQLASHLLDGAEDLSAPTAFAHMDPPTPWITWVVTQWCASKNQNLLHPATAPVAREIEQNVVNWLAPFFGMNGGHMVPGSSLANLTALWAAREVKGVKKVYASTQAHLSVEKAAHILGLDFKKIDFKQEYWPDDIAQQALVLTAGTTSTGEIEPLKENPVCAWLHVDAAWAGPLRLSSKYQSLLGGIETADSVCVSAHKWLFQPKESALIFFKDTEVAHKAISFGGAYLAVPNVGLQGSHGAMAAPLIATVMAYGRTGMALMIEKNMKDAERFADFVESRPELELYQKPITGIVNWRCRSETLTKHLKAVLPKGSYSWTTLKGQGWFRQVAANANFKVDEFMKLITDHV